MGRVSSGRSGTGRRNIGEVRNVCRTLEQVRDGLGYPRGDPGWDGIPSERSGTGRGTCGVIQDGTGYPRRGTGRVWDPQ